MPGSGTFGDEELLYRSVPDRLANGLSAFDEKPTRAHPVPPPEQLARSRHPGGSFGVRRTPLGALLARDR